MTSISFGGGPTIEQRRDFSGLKDGTNVPGYRGYCPQIKYRVGKTYGNDTYELAHINKQSRHPQSEPVVNADGRRPLQNQLPESTGDNKYTKTMVPGYTGYVPRMPFKFGGTYKEDCDWCIDQHMTNIGKYRGNEDELIRTARSFPTLQPLQRDPRVRDHLNTYRDTHPSRPTLVEDRRGSVEPPMPGYQGYIPRIHTTELGLGCRYNQMTKNGLEAFWAESAHRKAVQSAPISINRSPTKAPVPTYNRRLYVQDGMIPKYTGYLPQGRFNFGNTYADTSRSLEVCAHDLSCFGDYTKAKSAHMYQSVA